MMSTYLGVMGRVLLQNTSFFSSLLNEMAHKFNQEVRISLLKLKTVFSMRIGNNWGNNNSIKLLFKILYFKTLITYIVPVILKKKEKRISEWQLKFTLVLFHNTFVLLNCRMEF